MMRFVLVLCLVGLLLSGCQKNEKVPALKTTTSSAATSSPAPAEPEAKGPIKPAWQRDAEDAWPAAKPVPQPAGDTSGGGGTVTTTQSGLKIEDVKVGDGAVAAAGKTVKVHYTGTLDDGSKFDSSRDHGQPFSFTLGAGQVIKGWDEGVAGMKVGGKRKLTIPSALGYGAAGSPPKIPGGATLHFDIELLGVE